MVRKNYTYCNSPEKILKLASASGEYRKMLEESRENARFAISHFADRVGRLSGWAHDFVCPDCAAQMTFDINRSWEEGRDYTCPICGKTASGEAYDAAWVYYYRYYFSSALTDVALQVSLGDREALFYLLRYLDFYAGHYSEFPLHGRHAGKGCIMEQGLDEAVFAIALLRALKVAGDQIPEKAKKRWLKGLFMPIVEVLRPQINIIHNIPCWMDCAIGMIGLYFGEEALLKEALDGPYGIRNQIREGYTADGIWYEGSMGYHFYTTECLTYFFSFYAEKEPESELFSRFESMYTSPLALSYDGHALCALNDGWYPISMPTGQTAVAARILETPALEGLLKKAERPGGVWRLLLDSEADDGITLMADTRLAVFRRPLFAILKGSVLAVSHMHRDVLSLRLPPYSDDLGTPGYAHPLTFKWYRMPQSHNTVMIDGDQPDAPIASSLEKLDGGVCAKAESWRGVEWSRTLLKKDGALIDRFALKSQEEHKYTWLFHVTGDLLNEVDSVPAILEGEAFVLFREVRKVKCEGVFCLTFAQADGKKLSVSVENAGEYGVYLAKTPGNPANSQRNCLILQKKAEKVCFEAAYTLE